ncbi:MAG: hypothetical protein AMXMBFR7_26870 [Planctomycetota bacterium]
MSYNATLLEDVETLVAGTKCDKKIEVAYTSGGAERLLYWTPGVTNRARGIWSVNKATGTPTAIASLTGAERFDATWAAYPLMQEMRAHVRTLFNGSIAAAEVSAFDDAFAALWEMRLYWKEYRKTLGGGDPKSWFQYTPSPTHYV